MKASSFLVYVVEVGPGKVHVGSTRHGLYQANKVAKKHKGSIMRLTYLPLADELACVRFRTLSEFIRQDFILVGHSKADIKLAKRLFLDGEKTKRKGSFKKDLGIVILEKLQNPPVVRDEFADIPLEKEPEPFSWGA